MDGPNPYRYDLGNAVASARFAVGLGSAPPQAHEDQHHASALATGEETPGQKTKPFVAKLAYALEHPELYGDVIRWSDDGTLFILAQSNDRLVSNLLPSLFAHQNLSSFLRQLGVYSFTRIPAAHLASLIDTGHALALPLAAYSGWQNPSFFRGTDLLWKLRPRPTVARLAKKEEKRVEREAGRAQQARRHSAAALQSARPSLSGPSRSTVSSHGGSVSEASSGRRSSHGDGFGVQEGFGTTSVYSSNSSYSQNRSSLSGSVESGGSIGRSGNSSEGFQQMQNLNLGRNSIPYSTQPDFLSSQPRYQPPPLPQPPYHQEFDTTLRSPTFSSFSPPPPPFYVDQSTLPQFLPLQRELHNPDARPFDFPPPPPTQQADPSIPIPPSNPDPNPYE